MKCLLLYLIAVSVQAQSFTFRDEAFIGQGAAALTSVTISNGQTFVLNAGQTYQYATVTVQSGGLIQVTNTGTTPLMTQLICQNLVLNAATAADVIKVDTFQFSGAAKTGNIVTADGVTISQAYPAARTGGNGGGVTGVGSGASGGQTGGGGGNAGDDYQTGSGGGSTSGGTGGAGFSFDLGATVAGATGGTAGSPTGQNGTAIVDVGGSGSAETDGTGGGGGFGGRSAGQLYIHVTTMLTSVANANINLAGYNGYPGGKGGNVTASNPSALPCFGGNGGGGGGAGNSGTITLKYTALTGVLPSATTTNAVGGAGGAGGTATGVAGSANGNAGNAGTAAAAPTKTFVTP